MTNKSIESNRAAIGAWAKRCYFAGRALMEAELRPHDLGATQWYVLHHLAHIGPTMQRDLLRALEVERATLSVIIGTLVRKGHVEQVPDTVDQRRKLLRLTPAGEVLWKTLPDLEFIHDVAFGEIADADAEVAVRVLEAATLRLTQRLKEERRP